MRWMSIVVVALSWTLAGTSCGPLIDLDRQELVAGLAPTTDLAITLRTPASSRTVPVGTVVDISWSGANKTGDDGILTVSVRKRDDRVETILRGGIRVNGIGVSDGLDWDTSSFAPGRYNVLLSLTAGEQTKDVVSTAVLTLDSAPAFTFTEPTSDSVLENDADPSDDETPKIVIGWSASDEENNGKASIELDSDLDRNNGNEVVLATRTLTATSSFDSLDFGGNDNDGERVAEGVYHLFARISDDAHDEQIVEANVTITVPAAPDDEEVELAVTEPAADKVFLASDAPVTIEYTLNEEDEVLIDLKIDTDDAHTNGNEQTILSQRLVPKGTKEGTFDWNGTDSDGAAVPDGIYRTFILVNRGSGTPPTAEAEGLFFRRSDADKPLVGVTAPTTDITGRAGSFVTITWRDDAPSAANVFLFIDDDVNPQEDTETGAAEIQILANRTAGGDGVQDTFAYQIPSSLGPGTYYIFAYIDRDSTRPFDHSSVAAGRINIADPNN